MSRLLLVTFHYIRDPGQIFIGAKDEVRFPGIHPLGTQEFAEQISWLSDHFHIATPQDAEAHILGQSILKTPSVLVTFDDGLVDHGPAARILEDAGIRGVFFVASRPLTDGQPLMVHKAHWLRATTQPDQFRVEFNSLIPAEWSESLNLDEDSKAATKIYIYDTPADALLKYRINFRLPSDVVDGVMTAMLDVRGVSGTEFCQSTYLDALAVRALQDAGHKVAAHGHHHIPFGRLNAGDLAMDIGANLTCLEDLLGTRPTWVSYPNGRDWAVPEDTAIFCRRFGFSIGVTLNRGWVEVGADPTQLNRVNTNEVATVALEGMPTNA